MKQSTRAKEVKSTQMFPKGNVISALLGDVLSLAGKVTVVMLLCVPLQFTRDHSLIPARSYS